MIYKNEGYGKLYSYLSLFFLFSFLNTNPAFASSNPYQDLIIKQALKQELHEDKYWHTLLHYKGTYGYYESLIDDPKFFTAEDGKTNPKNELIETIKTFFESDLDNPLHGQCRFIARFNWIKERLNLNKFDESEMPKAPCLTFNSYIDTIKPTTATLIFPTAHMNNPASMFGHTLLRINTERESKLLSYAVNYSALTNEENGISFAFKGLFGLYNGGYSLHKYYEKVNTYSNIKFRDIWEYELDFNEEEVHRMLMHLWELSDVYSYYYFLDENCSYNLLFLLESARPGLRLTYKVAGFGFWVIPIDTIRKAFDNSLISKSIYRPSKASKIKHMASFLSKEELEVALDISNGRLKPIEIQKYSIDAQIKILDLTAEFTQAQFAEKEITKQNYRSNFISILRARTELGAPTDEDYYKVPPPLNPIVGHKSGTIAIGVGRKRSEPYLEFTYRSAFHDLVDNQQGFLKGSAIEFPSFSVRNYTEADYFEIEKVNFITITSLSPRDTFFKPLSWSVNLALKQRTLKDEEEHMIFNMNASRGVSYESDTFGIGSFRLELEVLAGGAYNQNHSAGLGASFELSKSFHSKLKTYLLIKGMNHSLGDRDDSVELTFGQLYSISKDMGLKLHITRDKNFGHLKTDSTLELNIYF